MDSILKLFDVHKQPYRFTVALALAAFLLVFTPVGTSPQLDGLSSTHRAIIFLVFLGSSAVVVVFGAAWVIGKVHAAKRDKALREDEATQRQNSEREAAERREQQRRLLAASVASLDHAEKAVLREFFLQGRNTIELPMTDPAVVGLEAKGIVDRIGSSGFPSFCGLVFPYALTPEGSAALTYEAIDLPTTPSETDRRRIAQSRPRFVADIKQHHDLMGM